MSTEIFSSIVHIPSARRGSVNERQEDMTSLEIERMTYGLRKALDSYDEEAVIKAIRKELSAIEDRFEVSFQTFNVTLANNKTHNVSTEKSENDDANVDVFLEFGATKHGT